MLEQEINLLDEVTLRGMAARRSSSLSTNTIASGSTQAAWPIYISVRGLDPTNHPTWSLLQGPDPLLRGPSRTLALDNRCEPRRTTQRHATGKLSPAPPRGKDHPQTADCVQRGWLVAVVGGTSHPAHLHSCRPARPGIPGIPHIARIFSFLRSCLPQYTPLRVLISEGRLRVAVQPRSLDAVDAVDA